MKEVSPTLSSELDPARMEKRDQSAPSFTDARDESLPPTPTTADSEDVAIDAVAFR